MLSLSRFCAAVCCAVSLTICAASGTVQAGEGEEEQQQEEFACEHTKLNTQDADPWGAGEGELDFRYTFSRATRQWGNDWDGQKRSLAEEQYFEAYVLYGLSDNLEVSLGSGYADLYDRDEDARTGRGPMDLWIALKWKFYDDEESALKLAYVPGVTIPTGRRAGSDHLGTSQECWTFDQQLALTKDWGLWTANCDVGYWLPFGDEANGWRGTFTSDAALGYHVTEWLQPECELNYAHDVVRSDQDADDIAVTAGFIICASDHLRLDVGAQRSVAGRNADRGICGILNLAYIW